MDVTMVSKTKAQCGSKLFLVDVIDLNDKGTFYCTVYLKPTKASVKRYCKDTELPFKEGMRSLYRS
jgi:hypothetical protein